IILDKKVLASANSSVLIIDLASKPGGVDFEAAKKQGIDAVRALSLPGQSAPKSAGDIIKKTVFNILKEVYG
ncbi:MAG: dipicolinate synthase subunit DpsA, partial [Ruminococcus sp.]|nr:dipicolinate synthase subunit DpsA [Ruminococcus sp.]